MNAAQEWLPWADRQFIHGIQTEPVPDIKRGMAVVAPAVFRVHDDADLAAGLTSGNGGLVIQTLSECVVGS